MKTTLHNEILASKNEYRTNKEAINHIPLFPTFYFYRKLYKIIVNCANLGKKGLYNNQRWTESAIDIMQALESAGVVMNFYGMENVKNYPNPTIFLSNHMSTLETMVPVAIIEPVKPVLFVIKKELTEYPVFKHLILAREPIIVGRQNPKEDLLTVLNEGTNRLKEGTSIILFPQKTRSPIFDVKNFNSLGVKLAKRSGVTVTPMAVLTDAWSNGKIIKEIGKININKEVHIAFGKPIEIKGNGAEENQQVISFIKQKLIEWGRPELIVE
ncbi:MAG TPA: lysophospholipid acyltransferase family protein [Melioribacteraceae bacterium]|nr:lysophospholipid acyltransferase family protein [Melioribacteraceae bacterium]